MEWDQMLVGMRLNVGWDGFGSDAGWDGMGSNTSWDGIKSFVASEKPTCFRVRF